METSIDSKVKATGQIIAVQNVGDFCRLIIDVNGEFVEVVTPSKLHFDYEEENVIISAFSTELATEQQMRVEELKNRVQLAGQAISTARHTKRHLVSNPAQLTPNTYIACYNANYGGSTPQYKNLLFTRVQAEMVNLHMNNGQDSFYIHEESANPIAIAGEPYYRAKDVSLDYFEFDHED